MTFGGYYPQDESDPVASYSGYNYDKNEITAHRISGSFHWEFKLMGTRFNGGEFTPDTINAFFDSGTSGVYIPSHDAPGYMAMICDNFPESSGMSCDEKYTV